MIRGWWWKILGVVLVLYSLVAGLLIPLGPGIISSTPGRIEAGSTTILNIRGYNTAFEQGQVGVWLRLSDDYALRATKIDVNSPRDLKVEFRLPKSVPATDTINSLNLVIAQSGQSPAILPSAVALVGNDGGTDVSDWVSTMPSIVGGSERHFPFRNILAESIRNNYYHVPLWFAMMLIFTISMTYSVRFLRGKSHSADQRAYAFASVGTFLGILGILTGAIWAKHTWGAFWSFDVKQNMAAIAVLIYIAYFILRNAVSDPDVAKRFAAVYNIFAFLLLVPLLFIIPRMTESLHPGSGGNPAFARDDLDNTMRMVFYPAVIGWMLLSLWIGQLYQRILGLEDGG